MKQNGMSTRHHEFFKRLTSMPQKIQSFYDNENIADFVLHDLCSDKCLNLSKAAYFVDNPDFDCFKGVGGYDSSEKHIASDTIWSDIENFNKHLNSCNFNKQVRNINLNSKNKNKKINLDSISDISKDLGFKEPAYYSWSMKHGNHGVILFQANQEDNMEFTQDILTGLAILGFCPVN